MSEKIKTGIVVVLAVIAVIVTAVVLKQKVFISRSDVQHDAPQATEQQEQEAVNSTITSSDTTVQQLDEVQNEEPVIETPDTIQETPGVTAQSDDVQATEKEDTAKNKNTVITPELDVDIPEIGGTASKKGSGKYFKAQDGNVNTITSIYREITRKDPNVEFKNDGPYVREWIITVDNREYSTGLVEFGGTGKINAWKISSGAYSEYNVTVNDRKNKDGDVVNTSSIKVSVSREDLK